MAFKNRVIRSGNGSLSWLDSYLCRGEFLATMQTNPCTSTLASILPTTNFAVNMTHLHGAYNLGKERNGDDSFLKLFIFYFETILSVWLFAKWIELNVWFFALELATKRNTNFSYIKKMSTRENFTRDEREREELKRPGRVEKNKQQDDTHCTSIFVSLSSSVGCCLLDRTNKRTRRMNAIRRWCSNRIVFWRKNHFMFVHVMHSK